MSETTLLRDPGGRLQIEYSRAAMERIRLNACDGLLALPRIGMGVGGLLLGSLRRNDDGCLRVTIDASIDLPCSHAGGPAFRLTEEEIAAGRELIGTSRHKVVGWYCSRTRVAPAFSDADAALHRDLFGSQEGIAMIMRPSTIEPTQAALFFPDGEGGMAKGTEWGMVEWNADQVAGETEAEPAALMGSALESAVPPVAASAPMPRPAAAEPLAAAAGVPDVRQQLKKKPSSQPGTQYYYEAPPARSRTGLVLALAGLLVLGLAAFVTRGFWMSRPPLSLTDTNRNGVLLFRWDPDAVRGYENGSLALNDGGTLSLLPLDYSTLQRGYFSYQPRSARVTATLSAGSAKAMVGWQSATPAAQPAANATPATQP